MPYSIEAKVTLCGRDIIVVCGGGTKYHTGAVAVAISTASLKNPIKIATTVSTIGIPGHKEDQIAREADLRLSKMLAAMATVSVGIHIDDASPEDIKLLIDNFYTLIDQVIAALTCLDNSQGG